MKISTVLHLSMASNLLNTAHMTDSTLKVYRVDHKEDNIFTVTKAMGHTNPRIWLVLEMMELWEEDKTMQ